MAFDCPLKFLKGTFQKVIHLLFLCVTLVARKCFEWKNGVKGGRVTPIINPILMNSATKLAEKIRTKEVSKLKFLVRPFN